MGARRAGFTRLVGLVAAALALGGCLGWPQAGYGPGKTSYSPNEPTFAPGEVPELAHLWDRDVQAATQVIAWKGLVHVLADPFLGPPTLTTFNAASGDQLWSASLGDPVHTMADYIFADGDEVHAVTTTVTRCAETDPRGCFEDFATTEQLFDADTGAPAGVRNNYGPSGDTGLLLDSTIGRNHSAVRFQLGGVRLVPRTSSARFAEIGTAGRYPVLDERGGRVITSGDSVSAWSTACAPSCGNPLWTRSDGPYGPAVVDDTGVYVVQTGIGELRALDRATGETMWAAPGGFQLMGNTTRPAVRDGTVYMPSLKYAIVWAYRDCGQPTCVAAWVTDEMISGGPALTPVAAGSLLYVARPLGSNHETQVLAYTAGDCPPGCHAALTTVTVSGDPLELIVAQGRVIVRTTSGVHTYAIRR
jgi:hypothetical protein